MMSLTDTWAESGNDPSEFFRTLRKIDDATYYLNTRNVEIWTVRELKNGKLMCANAKGEIKPLSIDKLKLRGCEPEIIEETLKNKTILLCSGGDNKPSCFFISNQIWPTMEARIGIGGENFDIPSDKRNAYLDEALNTFPHGLKIMYRMNDGHIKKAFAVFSPKYTAIKQSALHDVCNSLVMNDFGLGAIKYTDWSIDHTYSVIHMVFPDKEKDISNVYGLPKPFTPGLFLATSDVGECSLTAIGTLENGMSRTETGIYRKQHRNKIDVSAVMQEIEDTVFAKYTVVPKKLAELLTVDIDKPEKAYRKVLTEIGIGKILGKEIKKQVTDELIAEINPSLKYTAYDIATEIMALPERLNGVAASTIKRIESVTQAACFVDYTDVSVPKVFLA